jgi:hypothetical protein
MTPDEMVKAAIDDVPTVEQDQPLGVIDIRHKRLV